MIKRNGTLATDRSLTCEVLAMFTREMLALFTREMIVQIGLLSRCKRIASSRLAVFAA
jgi:hypothetical protein